MDSTYSEHSGQSRPASAESVAEDGLNINGENKSVYLFKIGQQDVLIEQFTEQLENDLIELHLRFKLPAPLRFSINVWIPDDCLNACVTLNRQILLSWFAREPRLDLPSIMVSPCANEVMTITTLRPGKYQTLNFRWQDGDHLVAHMIIAGK